MGNGGASRSGQDFGNEGRIGAIAIDGVNGAMNFQLAATVSGSELNMSYSVMVYSPAGAEKLAPHVDMVLGVQMKRLKSFVETGRPTAQ